MQALVLKNIVAEQHTWAGKNTQTRRRTTKEYFIHYSLNANATNAASKSLFDRLVAKGKNKKLAIIAVANKLLKQVFGVVRTGTLFDRKYYETLA